MNEEKKTTPEIDNEVSSPTMPEVRHNKINESIVCRLKDLIINDYGLLYQKRMCDGTK